MVIIPVGILLYLVDSAQGGGLNLSAWARKKLEKKEAAQETEEKAKFISDLTYEGSQGAYSSPIQPSSAFHIRNRLLSKMGEKVGS